MAELDRNEHTLHCRNNLLNFNIRIQYQEVALHPSLLPGRLARRERHRPEEEHLLLHQNSIGLHHATLAHLRVPACVVSECVQTQRVLSISPSLAGLAGGWRGKRDRLSAAVSIIPPSQQFRWRLG